MHKAVSGRRRGETVGFAGITLAVVSGGPTLAESKQTRCATAVEQGPAISARLKRYVLEKCDTTTSDLFYPIISFKFGSLLLEMPLELL